MGVDFSQFVAVGYQISSEELDGKLARTTPAEYRYEDRFDTKTGLKKEPKKIITKYEETTYFLNGEEFSERWDLANGLEKFLGCSVMPYGDYMSGDGEFFIFSYHSTKECDARRCPEDGEIDLEGVISSQPKYKELREKLRSLGLEPGKMKIFNCYSVS